MGCPFGVVASMQKCGATAAAVPVVVVVVAGWWLGHVNWFAVQVQPVVIGAQLSAVIWRCVVPVRSHSPWFLEKRGRERPAETGELV